MISNSSSSKIAHSTNFLERNVQLVRDHLNNQMSISLEYGNTLIQGELKGLSAIFRPIVKNFYHSLIQKDIERYTRKTINGMLKMCRLMILEDIEAESPKFYQRMEQKFPSYLKNDQTWRQCKPNHPNFPRLVENLRNTFIAQLLSIMALLNVEKELNDYHALCRNAFKTADSCKKLLKMQTDAMLHGQEIIAEDLSILNIHIARDIIFRVLQKGFRQRIEQFDKDIDKIYA
ncbi:MAG: hypothetical protein ACTSVU_02560 [Promethearchaeota archaeon]